MGILNFTDELDSQFEETEVGSPRLSAGEYTATISGVNIVTGDKVWKPWVETALQISYTTDDGDTTQQIELAPLTDKTGQVSKGKMKFLKWQLGSLGYGGRLAGLENAVMSGQFHGNVVGIEVREEQQDRINPHTNKPYVNRETVAKYFVEAGLGATNGVGNIDNLVSTFDASEVV